MCIRDSIDTLDGLRLDGLVVAVDCGHGASCQTTPAALQRLGATVHAINTDYCGTDINVECGSTHLEPLRELVLRTHADIGLAHDGDADRVLFVDSEGNEIDGDYILAICGSFQPFNKNITAQRFFTIILGLFYLFYRVFMIVFFVFSSLF